MARSLVRRGIYTVPKDIALLWVRESVIPSGRQNIGSILKNAKLKQYNEMALLALSKGKCSQDNCYIEEIAEISIIAVHNTDILHVLKNDRPLHSLKVGIGGYSIFFMRELKFLLL